MYTEIIALLDVFAWSLVLTLVLIAVDFLLDAKR